MSTTAAASKASSGKKPATTVYKSLKERFQAQTKDKSKFPPLSKINDAVEQQGAIYAQYQSFYLDNPFKPATKIEDLYTGDLTKPQQKMLARVCKRFRDFNLKLSLPWGEQIDDVGKFPEYSDVYTLDKDGKFSTTALAPFIQPLKTVLPLSIATWIVKCKDTQYKNRTVDLTLYRGKTLPELAASKNKKANTGKKTYNKDPMGVWFRSAAGIADYPDCKLPGQRFQENPHSKNSFFLDCCYAQEGLKLPPSMENDRLLHKIKVIGYYYMKLIRGPLAMHLNRLVFELGRDYTEDGDPVEAPKIPDMWEYYYKQVDASLKEKYDRESPEMVEEIWKKYLQAKAFTVLGHKPNDPEASTKQRIVARRKSFVPEKNEKLTPEDYQHTPTSYGDIDYATFYNQLPHSKENKQKKEEAKALASKIKKKAKEGHYVPNYFDVTFPLAKGGFDVKSNRYIYPIADDVVDFTAFLTINWVIAKEAYAVVIGAYLLSARILCRPEKHRKITKTKENLSDAFSSMAGNIKIAHSKTADDDDEGSLEDSYEQYRDDDDEEEENVQEEEEEGNQQTKRQKMADDSKGTSGAGEEKDDNDTKGSKMDEEVPGPADDADDDNSGISVSQAAPRAGVTTETPDDISEHERRESEAAAAAKELESSVNAASGASSSRRKTIRRKPKKK